jgi:1-acyl-sn-glycerol-3-phosphate acyltransferase
MPWQSARLTGEGTAQAPGEEHAAQTVLAIVRELAAELHPGMPAAGQFGLDASIERDFGLDSLARVELALRLERDLAITVDDTALEESETVRDLARALAHAPESAAVAAVPGPKADTGTESGPIPAPVATLLDALEWHANNQPGRTHILLADGEPGTPITFGDLRREATAVAAGLIGRGIRPGEAVAIMLPTGREFFAAFYGALYAQAVPVPVYPPARPSQIEAHLQRVAGILVNCEARVLLTFERARQMAHVLHASGARLEIIGRLPDIAEMPAAWPAPPLKPGDTAMLQYTSGSTGRAKGVVITHQNLMANLNSMQRVTGVASTDCFVSWLPLYHDMGLIGACFGALIFGYRLVLMTPFSFLSHPVRWLRAIDRHRATITAAPNFAYEICLNKIQDKELEGLDLGSLRLAFNGAEAVSAQTVERFAERFRPYGLRREALMPVYGLAESTLGLTFPPVGRGPLIDTIAREHFLTAGVARPAGPGDQMPLCVVSCGSALPGHSIRIVDPHGALRPERTQGRIEFQGPSATSGYFRNPRETARLFDGEWLDTEDLGYLAAGELYVTGRSKDIIIRGGHNIHPQELEAAVSQLPGVRKGGVVAFPAVDRQAGTERIVVLVETRDELQVPVAELIGRVNRLAVDLIGLPVDEVLLVPPRTVLKTSSGKIRRAACRAAYERGELTARIRAPWRQRARLPCRTLRVRLAEFVRRATETAWGLRALFIGSLLAPFCLLFVTLAPGLQRRRRAGAAFARLALRLSGIFPRHPPVSVAEGPRMLVANHASYLDGLVLLAALPPDFAFVAKREFLARPVIGHLLRRIGCAFVERHAYLEAAASARQLEARLRAGESLLVFPEGTFRREQGLLPFHMGAFSAAAAAGARIVPLAILGTRRMLPDGAVLPRPAHIEVIVGTSIAPDDAGWRSAVKLRGAARRQILDQVREPDLEHPTARAMP